MDLDAIIWLALTVAFLIIEGACPLHLVSIWFVFGSAAALVAALLNGAIWLQLVLFFVVSCGLLLLMLPLVKKVLQPKIEKTNVDAVVGTRGYVQIPVDNMAAVGQVKLGGMEWTARSTNGAPIEAGTLVQVDRIEGVKVFVSPVSQEETVRL